MRGNKKKTRVSPFESSNLTCGFVIEGWKRLLRDDCDSPIVAKDGLFICPLESVRVDLDGRVVIRATDGERARVLSRSLSLANCE